MKKMPSLCLTLAVAFALVACDRDNPVLGPLPRIADEFLAEETGGNPGLLTHEQADALYDLLLPAFEPMRERQIPFTRADERLGYEVQEVRMAELRRSCDVAARIRLRTRRPSPGPMRLFYKAVDRKGHALGRGFAVVRNVLRQGAPLPADTTVEVRTALRLLGNTAGFKRFDRLVFLSREEFEAISGELRGNGNPQERSRSQK